MADVDLSGQADGVTDIEVAVRKDSGLSGQADGEFETEVLLIKDWTILDDITFYAE